MNMIIETQKTAEQKLSSLGLSPMPLRLYSLKRERVEGDATGDVQDGAKKAQIGHNPLFSSSSYQTNDRGYS